MVFTVVLTVSQLDYLYSYKFVVTNMVRLDSFTRYFLYMFLLSLVCHYIVKSNQFILIKEFLRRN